MPEESYGLFDKASGLIVWEHREPDIVVSMDRDMSDLAEAGNPGPSPVALGAWMLTTADSSVYVTTGQQNLFPLRVLPDPIKFPDLILEKS